MAPSPEHDKEPKAPDKSNSRPSDQVIIDITPDEPEQNNEPISETTCPNPSLQENTHLESLDEGGLKELLQEAIAYKNPKDREGKSRLFNVLLEQAEQYDETGSGIGSRARSGVCSERRTAGRAARYSGSGSVYGTTTRRDLPHSGSLQDLNAAAPLHATPAVSHRAHSGGSLPCVGRVPTDYVATVHCVNPPPLEHHPVSPGPSTSATPALTVGAAEETFLTVVTSDEAETDIAGEMDVGRTPKLPRIPVTYTARASFEISAGNTGSRSGNNNCAGRGAVTTTTSSLPLQLGSGYSSVTSITGVISPPLGRTSSSPPVGSLIQASSSTITPQPIQLNYQPIMPTKSRDENGNSVQTFNHQFSSSMSQHLKKPKLNRKKNKETEVRKAEQIAGWQGFKEIDDILKFIEPELDIVKHHHHKGTPRSTHKSRDDGEEKTGKKRSTERKTKDKLEPKIKKANSLEEMSCSKLEDLTSDSSKGGNLVLRKNKKQSIYDSSDSNDKKNERRSWGSEARESYSSIDIENANPNVTSLNVITDCQMIKLDKKKMKTTNKPVLSEFQTYEVNAATALPEALIPFENLEFQTVTKKKKNRKRHSPYDENRARGNKSYSAYPKEYLPTKSPNAEMIYVFRNQGSPEHRRKSASSVPPSDKSNDSNDDLDSVHSLPVESTAEKMSLQQISASSGGTPQASYADITKMANAIPPLNAAANPLSSSPTQAIVVASVPQETLAANNSNSNTGKSNDRWPTISPKIGIHSNSSSPPNGMDTSINSSCSNNSYKSPPVAVINQTQVRGHNYPDIVESCTKTLESENRNLYHKEIVARTDSSPAELQRNYTGKLRIVDAGTQMEAASNPTYDVENYPALDIKVARNATPKLKNDTKIFKALPLFPSQVTDKKVKVNVVKPTTKELISEETILAPKDATDILTSTYMTFIKQSIVNNIDPITVMQFEHSKNASVLKAGMLQYKLDGIMNKPPDVLPVPEVTHDSLLHQTADDNRPAVVILSEEIKISNEIVDNIEGLTFGFDINEQLLNGEVSPKSSLENLIISEEGDHTQPDLTIDESQSKVINLVPYNFHSDFPAINEKPQRETRLEKQKNQDDHRLLRKNGKPLPSLRESSKSILESDGSTKETINNKDLNSSSESDNIVITTDVGAKCDLVSDNAPKVKNLSKSEIGEDRRKTLIEDIASRYLSPVPNSNEPYNLDKIVHFVEMAWEDVLKSPSNKVHYFGKQK